MKRNESPSSVTKKRKKSKVGGESSTPEGSADELDFFSIRPTEGWWDYENYGIPSEIEDHSSVSSIIKKKLKEMGCGEPMRFHVVVGYQDSILPNTNTKDIKFHFANECNRPKNRNTSKNQAADIYIKLKIKKWLDSPRKPQNVLFISKDCGFSSCLDDLMTAGHRIILVSDVEEDPRAHRVLTLRDCLDLPVVRALSGNALKEYEKKKSDRNANKKTNRNELGDKRRAAVSKAKDETQPVPACISERENGGLEIQIDLEIGIAQAKIVRVENDFVYAMGAEEDAVLREIRSRIPTAPENINIQRVPDSNRKWIALVNAGVTTPRKVWAQFEYHAAEPGALLDED